MNGTAIEARASRATGSPPGGGAAASVSASNPRPPILPAPARVDAASHDERSGQRAAPYEIQFDYLDRFMRAAAARLTLGLSPHAVGAALFDWSIHMLRSPGRQADLAGAAIAYHARLAHYAMSCAFGRTAEPPFAPSPGDHRFDAPEWHAPPACLLAQSHLALESWWALATAQIRGMSEKHVQRVAFMTSQLLDVVSPTNSALTNPVIASRIAETGGMNLWHGALNLYEDVTRDLAGEPPRSAEAYRVGRDLALTPGTVVFRNHLFELILYRPTTETVHLEPLLVVPAWIMKFYILDLQPRNSLVRYLVGRGHTVLMMSWRNPGPDDRDLSLDDYRRAVMTAVGTVSDAFPGAGIHLAGYCLGGTIAAIAAATMARDDDRRLASLTLLAAQTDFSEAGEMMLFVDESQIAFLEDMMWAQGVLKGRQMSGAFHMLRSNELVWSRIIKEYVLGERAEVFDIQAWSEDPTRMPYKMHSQYLRGLFLENRLTGGRFAVEGRVIALQDIDAPMFVVGTESDHIAPWRSVYKATLFTDNELTFVLTNGGHNAGIVSEPGHGGRHYRIGVRQPRDLYRDPATWNAATPSQQGSWWPAWSDWLASKGSAGTVPARPDDVPRGMLQPLEPAPGRFVLRR